MNYLRVVERELDLVSTGYDQYNQDYGKDEANLQSSQTPSNIPKSNRIKQIMSKKIKNINDSMDNVLKYAFDVINDKILNKSKSDIIDYCKVNIQNPKKLSKMGIESFSNKIIENCIMELNHDTTEIEIKLQHLYKTIAQYGDYKDLEEELKLNQNNSCCTYNCNYTILPSLTVYQRKIEHHKMTLYWKRSKSEETNIEMKQLNHQIDLNITTKESDTENKEEEDIKMEFSNDQNNDDHNFGQLAISLADDASISSLNHDFPV